MPKRSAMEILQVGYLHAVVAAAGCTLSSPNPDRGIDWILGHASDQHVGDPEATLKVALKSTHQLAPPITGDYFSFTLEDDHFQKLSVAAPTVNRLLVVMVVPRDMRHWILATGSLLQLRHCAYWVNLAGHPQGGAGSTTVHIRTDHVFDDAALCDIMRTVGQGGVPR